MSTLRAHVRVSGSIELDGHPHDVFPLFTAEGERGWVPDWSPVYPALPMPDESPGTAFLTENRGSEAIWMIVDRDEENHRGRYVSVMPGARISLISVTVSASGPDTSRVDVSYSLTSLSPDRDRHVRDFGAGFQEMLDGWKQMIEAAAA